MIRVALLSLALMSSAAAQTVTLPKFASGPEPARVNPSKLNFDQARRQVVITSHENGKVYRWRVRDGANSVMLREPKGYRCPTYRQTVRLTRSRLVWGYSSSRGHSGRESSISRVCLRSGKTCPVQVVMWHDAERNARP